MNQPNPDKIMQIGMGFWASKTLLTATDIGVFTELAKAPADCDALSAKLGINKRGARDFFDALVALGMLERNQGVYSNTSETGIFLNKESPAYIGGIFEYCANSNYNTWGSFESALRTGEPQSEAAKDPDLFKGLYADPVRLKAFLAAMSGICRGTNMVLAQSFEWSKYKTFADIGPAQGDLPVQIASAQKHMSGIGFDLPPVEPVFNEYIAAHGVADRVKFHAGDFFKDDLPGADVITMGHVLHDWDLPTKQMLIKKAYDALPEGGAFIAYDALIDDDRSTNAFGLLMSLNMLVETHGGFDFTGADCAGWMKEAGFKETRVQHLLGPDSMVVGIK